MAVLVLVPVAAIIALGAYGSTIGGTVRSTSKSGVEISLTPSEGLPGSPVRIEGRKWPPRSEVAIFAHRSGKSGDSQRFPIARAISSRNGTFALEFVIPTGLAIGRSSQLFIEAESSGPGKSSVETSAVAFELLPFQNELTVKVIDSSTSRPLSGVRVEITNFLGATDTRGVTDPTGTIRFDGLSPGIVTVEAGLLDYRRNRIIVAVPKSGDASTVVELAPDPAKRLYFPVADPLDNGQIRVAGVDRASALRSDSVVNVPVTPPDIPASRLITNLSFFIPVNVESGADSPAQGLPDRLHAVFNYLSEQHRIRFYRRASSGPFAWYIGTSARGEILLVVEDPLSAIRLELRAIDPLTGDSRLLRHDISIHDVMPVASFDGTRYFFANRFRKRIEAVDIESGDSIASIRGVPGRIIRAASNPTGTHVYLLAFDGGIFVVDIEARSVDGPIAEVPGATWLASDKTGRRLYLVGPGLEALVVVDLDRDQSIHMAPLDRAAYWVWTDPEGPFIFMGQARGAEVTVVDAETLKVIERPELS